MNSNTYNIKNCKLDNLLDNTRKCEERAMGIRKISYKGYDVINNNFFAVEDIINLEDKSVIRQEKINFDTFSEYYAFLNGEIYDNACYYMYNFSADEISKYNIDVNRINFNALIDYTIDDDDFENQIEFLKSRYDLIEYKKKQNQKWLKRVLECNTLKELEITLDRFEKSKNFDYGFRGAFLYQFIKNNPKKAFRIFIKSINNREYLLNAEELCLYYSTNEVLKAVNFNKNKISKTSLVRYTKKLEDFAEDIDNGNYKVEVNCEFDKNINYYVIEECYDTTSNYQRIYKYFSDITELVEYLNGDLRNCDLSYSLIKKENVPDCKINEKTIFSLFDEKLVHSVKKYYKYNRKKDKNSFIVINEWSDGNGNVVEKKTRDFEYFFDFVHYLKNDLSDSDLLSCKGLINIKKDNDIIFTNSLLSSLVMKKLEIKYEKLEPIKNIISFDETKENEKNTQMILYEQKELSTDLSEQYRKYTRISYVSDIHLLHRLKKCETKSDIILTIRDILDRILIDSSSYLLIGGDISSDFSLYKIFIYELSKIIKSEYCYLKVFFVIGNHDLWDFEKQELNDIVQVYRDLLKLNNMYLVHNNLIYIENGVINEISEDELINSTIDDIRKRLITSNLIISGGIGFSGYNNKFNADAGIYRNTINRKQEINETKKFENIYIKLKKTIYDKNVIIFTHMPKEDWSVDKEYMPNWVYIAGHTHRNYYFDDGVYRVYYDNQLGYNYQNAFSKSFYIEYDYDLFADYNDGIHNITKEQYNDFYRGKNILMNYNRDGIIYMLKKNGYYCFIKPNKYGKLSILNGGTLKQLRHKDLNYYYENMDNQISLYKEPLLKYSAYQKKISDEIKKIGGSGSIHGCIVDIDFYNHIYVNPFDKTITGYCAYDIIDKFVYKNVPSLLKANIPDIYENYQRLISMKDSDTYTLICKENELELQPTYYPSTDIYKASREIKKMQRLNSGILSVWYSGENSELIDNNYLIDYNRTM